MGDAALWIVEGWGDTAAQPLKRIDRRTGAIEAIALPPVPEGHQGRLSGIQALDDGLYIEITEATLEGDYDFIVVTVYGYHTWRLRDATGLWEPLTQDLHLLAAGVDAQGRVLGSVFSQAGRAFAAYDPVTDALLINETHCLQEEYPWVVAGGAMWVSGSDGLWGVEAR